MKKLSLFSFLCLAFITLYPQSDSTRDYILDYKDPKTEIISKGRRLLIGKLLQNDSTKTTEVVNYLLAQEDENYLAFLPMERRLLYYWTGQYEKALADLPERTAFYGRYRSHQIQPEADGLLAKLHETLTAHQQEVNRRIEAAGMKPVDKEFHLLNFDYLLAGAPFRYYYRNDSFAQKAAAFLVSYPASPYATYLRRNVLREVVYADWGLAFEFFSGYGAFTEQLQTHFKNAMPFGVAFDVGYKNLMLYLRDFIGFSHTKDTVSFPAGNWKKGAQARAYLPEASIGYAVVDNRWLKLAPFAGIASASISPTENDKNKNLVNEDAELKFTTTYTAGLNVDVKFGRPDASLGFAKPGKSYWFLRLRYAYNHPQFDKKYTGFSGNIHYVTVGVGGFGRTVRRW